MAGSEFPPLSKEAAVFDLRFNLPKGTTMAKLEELHQLGGAHKGKLVFLVQSGDRPVKLCKEVHSALLLWSPYGRVSAMVVE